ncbi:MAG TPA: GAF domain-containing protein, partial [Gemmatimonadaceae bacterium]|nr:GAF domain-containing protein [Gemmatimonadaceae bacterium]
MNRTPNSADAAPAPPAALFEAILARAPIGFALIDRSFRYLWVNDAFLDIYELPAEPLIGKRVQDVIPSLWPEIEPRYERVLRGESISSLDVTATLSVHGGPPRHFIVSHFPVRISGEIVGIGVIINDVSEREEAREALAVRNNLYAMLAHTNRAVSQSRTTGELFDAICRIAVTAGKFTCAWIGVRDGTVVRQVARAGEDQGYLDALVISLEPTDPRSQGPTGQSFLTGRPWVVNDFVASAATKPWHEAARRVGFGASATFPLFERGQVVAVLTVYAGEAGFFTDDLVSALNEITPSVSFALNRFADERDREREQEALRLRDRAIQAAAQGIIIADTRGEDNPLVYASPG